MWLLAALAATPLAACGRKKSGPEKIRYDRDVCDICNMIISDPRFAAQVRAPNGKVYKFDDIGDAIHWIIRQDWYKAGQPPKEFWVMNMNDGKTWLDAFRAWYVPGVITPMDYGYGAVPEKTDKAVSFGEIWKAVVKRGLSHRCEVPVEGEPAAEAAPPPPPPSASPAANANSREGK